MTRRFDRLPERNGAPERIRTSDPQIRSLVLYPAELRARGCRRRQGRDIGGGAGARNPSRASNRTSASAQIVGQRSSSCASAIVNYQREAPEAQAIPASTAPQPGGGIFRLVGKGVVTGAADDDPSAIGTSRQARRMSKPRRKQQRRSSRSPARRPNGSLRWA